VAAFDSYAAAAQRVPLQPKPMCNYNAQCSDAAMAVTTMYAARSNSRVCVMQQSHGIAGGMAAALVAEHAITSQHLLNRTVRLVETTGSCRARSRPTPSSLGATRCSLTALRCAIAGDR
jgi:hypothetical protein